VGGVAAVAVCISTSLEPSLTSQRHLTRHGIFALGALAALAASGGGFVSPLENARS